MQINQLTFYLELNTLKVIESHEGSPETLMTACQLPLTLAYLNDRFDEHTVVESSFVKTTFGTQLQVVYTFVEYFEVPQWPQ
jgi:hypothetical protein